MNKALTYVLVGGASALAGAVAGYFLCKKRLTDSLQKRYEEAINEELARLREDHRKAIEAKERPETEKESKSEENPAPPISDNDIYSLIYDEVIATMQESGQTINEYRAFLLADCLKRCRDEGIANEDDIFKEIDALRASVKYSEGDESDRKEEHIPDNEIPQYIMSQYENQPPRVISLAEYENLPRDYFHFVTHTYFDEDDTLVDEGEELVDDIDRIVGDALLHFGPEAAELSDGDDNAVYVCNGNLGLAIEIVRVHGSYAAYMGMR